MINKKELDDLMKPFKLVKEGFAGILPNGNIVDIREFPDAIPIKENGLFGILK
jgi:hypothetical protein